MRALSIRQPYVEEILRGIKTIEYRSRRTHLVGGPENVTSTFSKKVDVTFYTFLYVCAEVEGHRVLDAAVPLAQDVGAHPPVDQHRRGRVVSEMQAEDLQGQSLPTAARRLTASAAGGWYPRVMLRQKEEGDGL
jgi:hypothetical protein